MHTDNKSKQLKVQNTLDARKRILDLHMQLILHVSTCQSTKCPSKNCAKMKGLFKHRVDCNIGANGGCRVCNRVQTLIQLHAKRCEEVFCPVPSCMAICERFNTVDESEFHDYHLGKTEE